jgi:AcrR family transcriptional regulator
MTDSRQETKNVRDRRFQRTRRLLLDAFVESIASREYDEITVADIVGRANVGRSTFYEHYESKEDLLRRTMEPIITGLGLALQTESATENLRLIVAHVRKNRRFAMSIFSGDPRRLVAEFIAEDLESRLRARWRVESLPFAFVASILAEMQIGLLGAWVSSESDSSLTAASIAAALVRSTQAAEKSLLEAAPSTSSLRRL